MLKMLGLDEIKTSNIITPSFSHTFDFNAVGLKKYYSIYRSGWSGRVVNN